MKITKNAMREFIKHKLATDKQFSEKALFKIYESQTLEEQSLDNTSCSNNVGFTSFDSFILSQFAKSITDKRKKDPTYQFSKIQLGVLFKKMPKYWKQILNICDKDKLEKYYIKHMRHTGIQMSMKV